jgi:hypothetical protein
MLIKGARTDISVKERETRGCVMTSSSVIEMSGRPGLERRDSF